MSGEVGLPFRTAYCSSKFAITGFFESLRMEIDDKNIAITIATTKIYDNLDTLFN